MIRFRIALWELNPESHIPDVIVMNFLVLHACFGALGLGCRIQVFCSSMLWSGSLKSTAADTDVPHGECLKLRPKGRN